jgi:hypothetical protein
MDQRGKFGYEGEGFDDEPRAPERDFDPSAARGWNIGREDNQPVDEKRGESDE